MWEPETGGEFFYEHKDHVRFRVESEVWCDQLPVKPRQEGDLIVTDPQEKKVPYTLIVSIPACLSVKQLTHLRDPWSETAWAR